MPNHTTLLALIASLVAAVSAPILRADVAGQAADQAALSIIAPGRTLLNATAAQLAAAVAKAIISDSNGALLPADLAVSAFEPVSVVVGGNFVDRVRSDRDTSAPLVTGSAITALISGSDANLGLDVAAITDSIVVVGGSNAKENLTTAGRAAVVKRAIGAISDAAYSNSSLLSLDQTLGQALAGDTFIESLPKDAFLTIIEGSLPGINGVTGKAQTVGPQAAQAFVSGLLASGTIPDFSQGVTAASFAVSILAKVGSNTSVNEVVANQVALLDISSDRFHLADVLFAKYPAAVAKITEGIAAVIPAGNGNEDARVAFLSALTSSQLNDAAQILEGAVYLDPFYAADFTGASFSAISHSSSAGPRILAADAPGIASGLGEVLGQDGTVLVTVAGVFGQAIGSGALPPASAASYATDLINGASKSTVSASQFTGGASGAGGGFLNIKQGITAGTVTDLVAIAQLFADGIVTANHSTIDTAAGANKVAAQIGALARAIAKFAQNEAFVGSGGISQPVASFLAGTLANYVASLNIPSTSVFPRVDPTALILAAIRTGIESVTNTVVDLAVSTAVTDHGSYPVIGTITAQETSVTNL